MTMMVQLREIKGFEYKCDDILPVPSTLGRYLVVQGNVHNLYAIDVVWFAALPIPQLWNFQHLPWLRLGMDYFFGTANINLCLNSRQLTSALLTGVVKKLSLLRMKCLV